MSAIRKNSPPVGTIKKLPNGTEMKMTIRGWERVNPVLAKQNKAKTKAKEKGRQKKAEQAVKDLRKNNNGKAGLPRTNTAP